MRPRLGRSRMLFEKTGITALAESLYSSCHTAHFDEDD